MGSAARTLHALLLASTLIISVGALVVTRTTGRLVAGFAALELVALAGGGVALAAVYRLRSRIPLRPTSQAPDAWWRESLGRALLLWGLLELAALAGALSVMLTGRATGFGILVVGALSGLILLSPARLAAG